ncbi:MAG: hypothetical protein R3B96_13795 [Pirellulaceae bacterium]
MGVIDVGDRESRRDGDGSIVLGVGKRRLDRCSTGASLTAVKAMSRVSVLELSSPSLTVKLTVRVAVDGLLLVFSKVMLRMRLRTARGRTAAQRQGSVGGVPDAGDSVLVDEGKQILATGVVAGDLHDSRFDGCHRRR